MYHRRFYRPKWLFLVLFQLPEYEHLLIKWFQEPLEALRELPPGSIFDKKQISSAWFEIMKKAEKFLKSTIRYVELVLCTYAFCYMLSTIID